MALSLTEARRILEKGASYPTRMINEAKKVVGKATRAGTKMAYGGSVGSKKHMYSGGGIVKNNMRNV